MVERILRAGFTGALALAVASCVPPQRLLRHSAEFRFGPEQMTTATADPAGIGAGGTVIYSKSLPIPSSERTLFVTLSTTGDTHGGAASWFSALLNGTACNPGAEGAGFAPRGWIPLQKNPDGGPGGDGGGGPGDLHDNSIYYTWCCVRGLRPGETNRVEIKMASSIPGTFVFIERSHFYIDTVAVALCTPAEAGPVIGAEALEAMPEKHREEMEKHQHQQ